MGASLDNLLLSSYCRAFVCLLCLLLPLLSSSLRSFFSLQLLAVRILISFSYFLFYSCFIEWDSGFVWSRTVLTVIPSLATTAHPVGVPYVHPYLLPPVLHLLDTVKPPPANKTPFIMANDEYDVSTVPSVIPVRLSGL